MLPLVLAQGSKNSQDSKIQFVKIEFEKPIKSVPWLRNYQTIICFHSHIGIHSHMFQLYIHHKKKDALSENTLPKIFPWIFQNLFLFPLSDCHFGMLSPLRLLQGGDPNDYMWGAPCGWLWPHPAGF